MKRTILLLMVGFIFAFASCDKDDDNGKLGYTQRKGSCTTWYLTQKATTTATK